MSISSLGGSSDIQNRLLQEAGLSKDLAQTAQSELQSALGSGGKDGANVDPSKDKENFDPSKIKEKVSNQLATDVKSGKLTQSQSDQITKALDKLNERFNNGAIGGGGSGPGSAASLAQSLLSNTSAQSGASGNHHSGGSSSTQADTQTYLTQLLSQGVLKTTA